MIQGLGRRRIECHLDARGTCTAGIRRNGLQRGFELQQQVAEAVEYGQVVWLKRVIGPGRHGDRVFRVVRNAYERSAGRHTGDPHGMQLHPGREQGGLQRLGVCVVAERQQHVRGGTTRAGAGNRLVGALAARIGVEVVAQHGFTWRRYMGRPYNKVKIGRAGDENHG